MLLEGTDSGQMQPLRTRFHFPEYYIPAHYTDAFRPLTIPLQITLPWRNQEEYSSLKWVHSLISVI